MNVIQFNQLEQKLLHWIDSNTSNPFLSKQIESVSLKRRDYTRTGFFIYLNVDSACASVPANVQPICPLIKSQELFDGAGCNLFLREGQLHYLEIYARGGFLPENLENFQLQPDV
ncbi:MAG: hypothetical protein VYA80_00895 [Pseudomonadota bacterium]|nr:hypothetical protein [Pseudomonadota bacterium]